MVAPEKRQVNGALLRAKSSPLKTRQKKKKMKKEENTHQPPAKKNPNQTHNKQSHGAR